MMVRTRTGLGLVSISRDGRILIVRAASEFKIDLCGNANNQTPA